MDDSNIRLGRNLVIITIIYCMFTQLTSLFSLFNEYGEDVIQPQNVLPLLFRIGIPILLCYLLYIGHKWVRWVLACLLMIGGLYYIYMKLFADGMFSLESYLICLGNILISLLLFFSRHIKGYIHYKDDEYMNKAD